MQWRKSNFSGSEVNCVEVGVLIPGAAVRDSKDRSGPVLAFPTESWTSFVAAVRTDALTA